MSESTGAASGATATPPSRGRHRAPDAPPDAVQPEPASSAAAVDAAAPSAVSEVEADLNAGDPAVTVAAQRRDTVTRLQPLPPSRDRRPLIAAGVAALAATAAWRRRR